MTQIAAFGRKPHSAVVDLWLQVGDTRIPLSHVAPNFVRTQWPHAVPAGKAVVVISVNGRTTEYPVCIDGRTPGDETEIRTRPDDSIPF